MSILAKHALHRPVDLWTGHENLILQRLTWDHSLELGLLRSLDYKEAAALHKENSTQLSEATASHTEADKGLSPKGDLPWWIRMHLDP